MNTLQLQAVDNFKAGMNCAQAVLTVFSEKYRINTDDALKISCGFGGGMGRLQGTCGAVTGSFMVFGLHACEKNVNNKDRKENAYRMIREFDSQFVRIHGTTSCAELLKVDLKTPEGQQAFHDNHLDKTICEKCIADAVKLVEDALN